MARTRYVKPEFFTDEDVGRLTPLERILFIGLWTEADCRGRLPDRPKTLKVKLLPWDECDVDAMLTRLDRLGFVQRYEANGVPLIQISNFRKHQKPHPKEADLGFADPPPRPSREISRLVPEGPATFPNEVKSIPTRPAFNGNGDGDLNGDGDSGAGAPTPPPPKSHALPDIQRPETPPEAWTGDDFWAWAQDRRRASGLAPERSRPKDLGRWYSAALMSIGGNVEALQEAFYRFGDDPFWQAKSPPLPFAGFTSQWDRFLPTGVTRAAS